MLNRALITSFLLFPLLAEGLTDLLWRMTVVLGSVLGWTDTLLTRSLWFTVTLALLTVATFFVLRRLFGALDISRGWVALLITTGVLNTGYLVLVLDDVVHLGHWNIGDAEVTAVHADDLELLNDRCVTAITGRAFLEPRRLPVSQEEARDNQQRPCDYGSGYVIYRDGADEEVDLDVCSSLAGSSMTSMVLLSSSSELWGNYSTIICRTDGDQDVATGILALLYGGALLWALGYWGWNGVRSLRRR